MYRVIVLSTSVLTALFLALTPVWAIENPTSVIIREVNVYRSLLEEDDMLLLLRYKIDYSTIPSEPVNETFLVRLRSSDGTTQIGVNTPQAYRDNGYGESITSLYLTPDEVEADSISWHDALVLRLEGNPTSFTDPDAATFTLATESYSTGDNSRENNRRQLTARILAICKELQEEWGGSLLLDETAIGSRLTATGELFVGLTIPGIRAMAPEAYTVQSLDPNQRPESFTGAGQDSAEDRYQGTFWIAAFDSLNEAWSLPSKTVQTALFIALTCFAAWLSHYMWGRVEPGFGSALMALPVFWYMGWVPFQLAAIVLFIVGAIAVTGVIRILFRGVA